MTFEKMAEFYSAVNSEISIDLSLSHEVDVCADFAVWSCTSSCLIVSRFEFFLLSIEKKYLVVPRGRSIEQGSFLALEKSILTKFHSERENLTGYT